MEVESGGALPGAPKHSQPRVQFATRARVVRGGRIRFERFIRPAQMIAFAFAVTILAGTTLLMLPISANPGITPHLVDALFTATSALCVTGLATVDTATEWSIFGRTVIAALIQLGGLGVMTFGTIVGIAFTKRVSLAARIHAASEARTVDFADARSVLLGIVRITLVVEGATAVLLFGAFTLGHGIPPLQALGHAVFHAISAFNNAGFSTFEGGLPRFVGDPFINLPIMAAIVLGGLGFPVIVQLVKHLGRWRRWSLNTRIVILLTPIFLVIGFVMTLLLEWNNPATLGALDPWQRILAAAFQSVQARTAGFNTIDFGGMHTQTLLVYDALMFIGGGPAGTAGGIRLTVFLVMLAMIGQVIRGSGSVTLLGKRVPPDAVRKASAVGLFAFGAVCISAFAISCLTEFTLDQILFETISAFGTVGLSTGITGHLPISCQLVLILMMYLGRLGPLTIAAVFVSDRRPPPFELPEERPIIA